MPGTHTALAIPTFFITVKCCIWECHRGYRHRAWKWCYQTGEFHFLHCDQVLQFSYEDLTAGLQMQYGINNYSLSRFSLQQINVFNFPNLFPRFSIRGESNNVMDWQEGSCAQKYTVYRFNYMTIIHSKYTLLHSLYSEWEAKIAVYMLCLWMSSLSQLQIGTYIWQRKSWDKEKEVAQVLMKVTDKSYLTKRLDLYLDKKTLVTHIRPSKYLT